MLSRLECEKFIVTVRYPLREGFSDKKIKTVFFFVRGWAYVAILLVRERRILVTQTLTRYIRKNGIKKGGLLFPNGKGGKYSRNGLYEYLTKYLKRRGYEHYGVHIFRHTFAKMLAKEGCPSITLARCLTHSTITQSEHYVNLYGAELRTACERFNPAFTHGKAGKTREQKRDEK